MSIVKGRSFVLEPMRYPGISRPQRRRSAKFSSERDNPVFLADTDRRLTMKCTNTFLIDYCRDLNHL